MFGGVDTNLKIDKIVDDLVDQYEFADKSDRSWIIGFSTPFCIIRGVQWSRLVRRRNGVAHSMNACYSFDEPTGRWWTTL